MSYDRSRQKEPSRGVRLNIFVVTTDPHSPPRVAVLHTKTRIYRPPPVRRQCPESSSSLSHRPRRFSLFSVCVRRPISSLTFTRGRMNIARQRLTGDRQVARRTLHNNVRCTGTRNKKKKKKGPTEPGGKRVEVVFLLRFFLAFRYHHRATYFIQSFFMIVVLPSRMIR